MPSHAYEAARVFLTAYFNTVLNLQLLASVLSLTVFSSVALPLISFNIPLGHGCSVKTEITVETYRLFLGLIEKKNLKPCICYATLVLNVKKFLEDSGLAYSSDHVITVCLVPVERFPSPLGQFTSVTYPRRTGEKRPHFFAWTT